MLLYCLLDVAPGVEPPWAAAAAASPYSAAMKDDRHNDTSQQLVRQVISHCHISYRAFCVCNVSCYLLAN